MSRPRLLDLFCGAGGAGMGYHRAGFDVVGVDIKPQPHYPFEFFQGDALAFPLDGFDAIHASPPCQAYTTMNNRHGSRSLRLIEEVRRRLSLAGVPWIIENVAGALSAMQRPIRLTGEMFGLRVHRPRLFESSLLLLAPSAPDRQAIVPTNVLDPPASGRWANQTPSGQNKLGPSPDRWKKRSLTYSGIAEAMADQWARVEAAAV